MGDIKQTNFRIDQETADKFRTFCEENGLNQAQGFDHIMQIVELDKAKVVTPTRQTEIEEFERAQKIIIASYLQSIEIANNAENRVKEQFASALISKDKTIQELQSRIEHAIAAKTAAEQKQKEAEKAAEQSQREVEIAIADRDIAINIAGDKERVTAMLTEKIADQKGKLAEYGYLVNSVNKLKEQIDELTTKLKEANLTIKSKEQEIVNMQKQAELTQQLAVQKAIMDTEHSMSEQLRLSDRENAKLQARIEQLEAQKI